MPLKSCCVTACSSVYLILRTSELGGMTEQKAWAIFEDKIFINYSLIHL